jgi:hypothetical protein
MVIDALLSAAGAVAGVAADDRNTNRRRPAALE